MGETIELRLQPPPVTGSVAYSFVSCTGARYTRVDRFAVVTAVVGEQHIAV